ncbi:hypothetical protein PR048_021030 [Dryococelus australis]|uniref:Uncharacterized protein n=1 Tax=Dryococelus australis TaxID=614101 RepID=A0ABQ9GX26_9NEOP|nr:hypothetical protein PR048_021030 [Dryococelus australis]
MVFLVVNRNWVRIPVQSIIFQVKVESGGKTAASDRKTGECNRPPCVLKEDCGQMDMSSCSAVKRDKMQHNLSCKSLAKALSYETGCDNKLTYLDFVPEDNSAYVLSEHLDLSYLKGAPKENLLVSLKEFSDVFLRKDQKLGCTDNISHSIETCDSKPIYVRPYHVPQSHMETLKEQIHIMLRHRSDCVISKLLVSSYDFRDTENCE